MKTLVGNTLRDATKTDPAASSAAVESAVADTSVSAGIADVLRMRVGCWRAPVHLTTVPSAA